MEENLQSEQLEEGEIIDDDDFEDISDNSIIEPTVGKFVSSNENLRALSLSSDSETTDVYKKRKRNHRNRRKRKKRPTTDSSDSDLSPSRDLKGKLKEAIHISGIGENKNPLETRLKAMGDLGTNVESQKPPPPPPLIDDSDKIDDNELENLRIEALKTAIINKFHRRKKKKTALEGKTEERKDGIETMENKENDTPKESSESSAKVIEPISSPVDLDEDEDVLRASLLAGLAKKITKVQIIEKPTPPKLPVQVAPVLPKRPIVNKIVKKIIQKPQVKPLIINVNDDSDSEEENKEKASGEGPKIADLNVITNNVEKFLKEQRAKFEIETKKRFQIVNKNKTVLEKSAVKLLPKSQQIEYQNLLKRLKTAERKKRAKKIALQKLNAQKTPEVVSSTIETSPTQLEVIIKPTIEVEVKSSTEELSNSPEKEGAAQEDVDRKKTGITSELTTLQRTLKEIKMQRNGSLQIKSKYQVLTPIIRKITVTSNERKKQEQRIRKLMQDLNEAKKKLAKSHETFSFLVKDLVSKKEKIDKSIEIGKDIKSVPIITSTPIKTPANGSIIEETAISTIITSSTNNDYEDMDVCYSDETDMCQIDIVDPNDIDQIFKRKTIKSTIPEYISPLNFNVYDRYRNVDPLGIMCPYEVNGSCRDLDCTFKHYLKNHERL